VPGGQYNTASAGWSLAAGRRAKALHEGSIVFGDARDQDKSSTGNNQFIIGSSGGVAINTTPVSGAALTVSGKVKADSAEFGAMTVATLSSTSVSGYGTIPIGGIIMWSGQIASIPDGWALCDGLQSTPDLRNRFVMGAGLDKGPLGQHRNVGATGGAETVTLTIGQLPAHNHGVSGNTSSGGAHTHPFRGFHADFRHGGAASEGSTKNDGDGSFTDTGAVLSAGEHVHSINLTSQSTGGGQAIDKLPPFYVLAYIMRIR
jgi:microcystin-dependent protein